MMSVNITRASARPGEEIAFSFEISAEELGLEHPDYVIAGPVSVTGSVMNTGSVYRLTGSIRCSKSFVCDRCLGDFTQQQEHSFSEDFHSGDAENDGSEAVNYFHGDAIDVAPLVRDTILAAQPLNNICSPDCLGLCPKCGGNLNEGDCGCDRFIPDPRLAALQQLKK